MTCDWPDFLLAAGSGWLLINLALTGLFVIATFLTTR
jgi:hypothetical protein